ncbi:MAG: 1-acyl-sn-glycerol-3-phosphate acyltransferase [Oscillospiraceae bacterium]|nr:1-acyl-sn-glycerol-3-phosphate acyltransferase [Oscillospiraceae bacterium]
MTQFYRVAHAVFKPLIWLFFPFQAHGLENIPEDRAVVLCGNHSHAIDPALVCLTLPRRMGVRIMAKKELMDQPVVGSLLQKLGAFPVDRGHSDLTAVKTAIQTIRDGANLLVFPEGTRVEHEGDVRAKGGVVMIAMRTGAPMVPVYVGGKKKLFHMTHIVFGEPYEPKTQTRHGTSEEYQRYADEIVRRAYELGRKWEKRS